MFAPMAFAAETSATTNQDQVMQQMASNDVNAMNSDQAANTDMQKSMKKHHCKKHKRHHRHHHKHHNKAAMTTTAQ